MFMITRIDNIIIRNDIVKE